MTSRPRSLVAPETSIIAPVISSAAPVVETTLVASPTGLCGLVPYTGPLMLLPLSFEEQGLSTSIIIHEFPIATVMPLSGFVTNGLADLYSDKGNRVGPLADHKLASRHASPRSLDHHSSSSSSSSDSSPVHSLGLDAPDQAHSGSSTRDSSSGDSSERPMHLSSHSAGPSRKDVDPRLIQTPLYHAIYGIISSTVLISSHLGRVDTELGIGDGDEVEDHVRIDHRDARDDIEEYEADASAGDMAGVRVDRIVRIETAQRRLEADQLIASGDRARMAEMIYSLRLENLSSLLWILRGIILHCELCFVMLNNDKPFVSGMTHAAIEEYDQSTCKRSSRSFIKLTKILKLWMGNTMETINGNGNGNDNGNGMETTMETGMEMTMEMVMEMVMEMGKPWMREQRDKNEIHNVKMEEAIGLVARECSYQDFKIVSTTSF
ncbi:hypothetical protein Tco_0558384 [Tanacetum coccineum]